MGYLKGLILKEGAILSDKNFEYNFDKFKSGEVNLLFIAGLSGSGKSTYGSQIAQEYNCDFIEMDILTDEVKKIMGVTTLKNLSDEEYASKVTPIMMQLLKGRRAIVDGVQTMRMDINEIEKHAVIILGTSFALSTLRAMKRDFEPDHFKRYGKIDPILHIKTNIALRDTFEKFKKKIQS